MSTTASPTMVTPGTICWHELITSDVRAAVKFYTSVFGWKASEWPMQHGEVYTILSKDDVGFGGIMAKPPQMPKETPPFWGTYVAVADVDQATKKATDLGGKVCMPPTDIPQVGRFSVVTDPSGAAVTLFKSSQDMPVGNAIAWNELTTGDQAKAVAFYTKLFGWTTSDMPMGPAGVYKLFHQNGHPIAGCMQKTPDMAQVPTAWTPYIGVKDISAAFKQAIAAGAKQAVPVTQISPEVGHFAIIVDPTGAVIALYQSARPC